MQWALVLTVTFTLCGGVSEERRVTLEMPRGCHACAPCRPRLFLLIWRDGIQQHVACVHACPSGYFSVRGKDINKCTKCRASSCDRCFSKEFCMKCKEGLYLYRGKCVSICPAGTSAQLSTRECHECELSSWGTWSLCSKNGERCGYKWGTESRTREEERTQPGTCQLGSQEERRCRLRRFCPGDKSERRMRRRKVKKQSTLGLPDPLPSVLGGPEYVTTQRQEAPKMPAGDKSPGLTVPPVSSTF